MSFYNINFLGKVMWLRKNILKYGRLVDIRSYDRVSPGADRHSSSESERENLLEPPGLCRFFHSLLIAFHLTSYLLETRTWLMIWTKDLKQEMTRIISDLQIGWGKLQCVIIRTDSWLDWTQNIPESSFPAESFLKIGLLNWGSVKAQPQHCKAVPRSAPMVENWIISCWVISLGAFSAETAPTQIISRTFYNTNVSHVNSVKCGSGEVPERYKRPPLLPPSQPPR
jgi:hypothetical protein